MAQDKNDKRGFASMDEEKQKEIASKGGKASHERDGARIRFRRGARSRSQRRRDGQQGPRPHGGYRTQGR
jgi:uncharacterized protein